MATDPFETVRPPFEKPTYVNKRQPDGRLYSRRISYYAIPYDCS